MDMGFRPRLGFALQRAIMPGDQPDFSGNMPPHNLPQSVPPSGGGFFKEGGMGRYLAGAIGDALLQNAGMRPVYAPMQQQQRALAAEDAQWSRRRQADNEDWQSREAWKLANQKPEVPAMLRNVQAWQSMTPEQRKAYQEMNDADRGPFTVLPNGQVWARDPALMQQFGGGGAAPQRNLGPVVDSIPGGPTQPASGTFRP